MEEAIFNLDKSNLESLGNIRCIPGLLAGTNEEGIWLRGIYGYPEIDVRLKQLPIKKAYLLNEHNLLFIFGSLTPVSKLPLLTWQPLKEYLSITIPVASLPGRATIKAAIKLVPTEINRPGRALLTILTVWKAYAESAPAIRLAQLKFAVAENNEVLIMGNPLPPLPGKEFWLEANILLPNGYQFEIALAANFISAQFNAKNDSVLLFDCDGSWQKIDDAFFVPAKRSAVRMTKEIIS